MLNVIYVKCLSISPVGARQDDASQSGQGREVETETHLEHDEGDEADLSLEGADTGLVRRDAGHQVTQQVEEDRGDQHSLRGLTWNIGCEL